MNKLLMFMMSFILLFTFSCGGDDPVSPGDDDNDEPVLVGCEAADVYDWDTVEFETSLDGGADTWIAFSLEELTYFTVVINQAGFQVSVYNGCDGENGLDPPLFVFETIGNGVDIGIVPAGDYWVKIKNTRPNRLDFTFRIELSDILYGCMDDDALNYDENANVDDGNCEYNDCNTDWYSQNYGDMLLDCDGNCAPVSWVGDGWCDDGSYAIFPSQEAYNNYYDCIDGGGTDCGQYVVPINLWCEELNWDEGDCEEIVEECGEGFIEDCNGNCAPEGWVGDGICDDGAYQHNGNDIFFNCEEFNNDGGDCDVLQRSMQENKTYPNRRVWVR